MITHFIRSTYQWLIRPFTTISWWHLSCHFLYPATCSYARPSHLLVSQPKTAPPCLDMLLYNFKPAQTLATLQVWTWISPLRLNGDTPNLSQPILLFSLVSWHLYTAFYIYFCSLVLLCAVSTKENIFQKGMWIKIWYFKWYQSSIPLLNLTVR